MPSILGVLEDHLSDDLRQPQYRGHPNPLRGHCYVMSEAFFYILGGKSQGWKPATCNVLCDGKRVVHWFLFHERNRVICDPTRQQFTEEEFVPYAYGRGRGFLTKKPSKRTRELIRRAAKTLQMVGVEPHLKLARLASTLSRGPR